MHRLRTLIVAGTLTALAATAFAAPASAAPTGRMIIVNGFPGKTIEVCINGVEVKRKLAYGKGFAKKQSPGSKLFKFKVATTGNCKGKLLAKKRFDLLDGAERTIVVTKKIPRKVVVFPDVSASAQLVFRHAADIGTASFKRHFTDDGVPWYPAEDVPYEKGDWGQGSGWSDSTYASVFWAYQPPDQSVIAGPIASAFVPDYRYEYTLVGTTLSNVRLVGVRVWEPGVS